MPHKSIQETREHSNKAAFDEVIDHYHAVKSALGSGIKALDYSRCGSGVNTDNVLIMSATEFVCDVELAAAKALTGHSELKSLFDKCYAQCVLEPDTSLPEIDRIRNMVGARFRFCRIFPVSSYFRPKVLDRSKITTTRKEQIAA